MKIGQSLSLASQWFAGFLFIAAAVPDHGAAAVQAGYRDALAGITAERLNAHLRFLSHDLLEGRAPGSRGHDVAALYIAGRFVAAGLVPPGDDFLQPVPLTGRRVEPAGVRLVFETGAGTIPARYPADVVVWPAAGDTAEVAGEVVFVGYGIHAPEYGWDDFRDRDLTGKILLVLVNEPPPTPEEPARFGGRALTYYGRWTYKLEEAARRGAAGALILHTVEGAGYPWSVVESSWTGEQLRLPHDPGGPEPLGLEGWLTWAFARELLASAGLDPERLLLEAASRTFEPVSTGIIATARVPARSRPIAAANVAGLVPGRHPDRRNEVVVYTAHYDHLGVGPAVDGDSIYNGTYDNASGVAVLLELARAFARLEPGPDRSVLFLATTAEEAGLLGARHYVREPLLPLEATVANINIDGANLWGETADIVALGAERSTLGRIAEARARELGMRLAPDRAPELGYFFRSDHFAFAQAGVPALFLEHGLEFRGRPPGWGALLMRQFNAHHYHRPSDRYRPDFDLAGAVQQARLAFLIGYDVARTAVRPAWHPGAAPVAPRR